MSKNDQSTIIVAGGSGYIGKHLVMALLNMGYKVVNLDLQDSADGVTQSESYDFKQYDFMDVDTLETRLVEDFKEIKSLVGIVCLAAYNQTIRIENYSQKEMAFAKLPLNHWENTFTVNVTSTMILNRVAAEKMKNQGFGSVVNISSIFGSFAPDQRRYGNSGLNSNAAYGASKAAVIQLTRFLASYYQNTGIRFNSISPGGIEKNQPSDFIEMYAGNTAVGRMGRPSDVVGAIEYLISEKSEWVTGTDLIVDGGYSVW